ncbi:MAG: hypothetical protein IKO80_01515 [Lachnospiraceae bacterium]|nr:hypothetical protein [Lachnospiraceae bacterium]
MKITRLWQDEAKYFAHLDPYGFMDRAWLPGGFAYAATVNTGEEDEPLGLLVGSRDKELVTAEWICVDPEKRFCGVGEELLVRLFETARHYDLPRVAARLIQETDLRAVMERAAIYFEERFFEEMEDLPGEWEVYPEQIFNYPLFKEDPASYPPAVTLASLKNNKVIGQLSGRTGAYSLFDIAGDIEGYDAEISSVLLDGEEPCGLLLTKRVNRTLFPVFFYSESDRETTALLLAAAGGLAACVDGIDRIRLISTDERVSDLARNLFPMAEIKSRRLIAQVRDYEAAMAQA